MCAISNLRATLAHRELNSKKQVKIKKSSKMNDFGGADIFLDVKRFLNVIISTFRFNCQNVLCFSVTIKCEKTKLKIKKINKNKCRKNKNGEKNKIKNCRKRKFWS